MRLERLEISGFKSFPERADLAFDRGVTAIVGPNGCGKSNVVDAITWVLGEQSAKSLRGERMEDVIFSGSDARKPTGAAEVRLRLAGVASHAVRQAADRRAGEPEAAVPEFEPDQMELPEAELRDVVVARRLYRSGESEYLIDGDVVRLRDVQDLLMDAGLGVKGYAVIEQGKIGQILGAKPTERRQLIEEAAGVTKYRSRRRTAELKLEAAQQNLTRVDDIVFELERQRAALKRQAAKARRYRRLREELRRWEKVLFARRYGVLLAAIDTAHRRLEEAQAHESQAAGLVTASDGALGEVRERLAGAEQAAHTAREAAHACQLDLERTQQQVEFERRQSEALIRTIADLTADLTALDARQEPARAEIAERRAAAAAAARERDEAAAVLAETERAAGGALAQATACEGDVEQARAGVQAALATANTLRNVIERSAEGRDRLAGELSRLDAEAADLRVEHGQLSSQIAAAREALAAARTIVERTREGRAADEAALGLARASREARLRDLRDRERELAATLARLRSLEELQAAREGYGEAARAILHDGAGSVPHLGSVADYLETDARVERAVEACLGDLLQAVLVPSREDAARGLEVVRAQNLGRCGFLSVEPATEAAPEAPVASWPGVVPLSSLVRVSGPHAAAIREAVGHTWVAETFDEGARAAAALGEPVVTLGGDLFRGGRLVYGGARAEARGILATKREIKELRERLATDRERAAALGHEVTGLEAAILAAEQAVSARVEELHAHEKTVLGHELDLTKTSDAIQRLSRKLELIDQERRRAAEERAVLEARQEEAEAAVVELETEQAALHAAFGEAQARLGAARDHAAECGRRATDAKAAHAALGERAGALATAVLRLEDAERELTARIAARRDELMRGQQQRTRLDESVAAGVERAAAAQREFATLQEHLGAADASVADLQAGFAAAEQALREARQRLDAARAVVTQHELARVTAESDLTHLRDTCREALDLDLAEVAAEVAALDAAGGIAPAAVIAEPDDADGEEEGEPVEPASTAPALGPEEAIADLRGKIDRLGPVNMMAIEQFDELEGRYTFLTGQRQDLVDSIASTSEAIRRIDRTTRERFQEAYTVINRNFEEMFTTLFGGGRAGLVLLDEADLLETGIDIIAQPPGKRLQNVQLLSGGEKALTAMALLFAMFRYRPSPFCLLDEIDAPLDDANIGRFLEMLKGMLDRTQFIVITHSRKTMEMADRLYGVTMEEPGVSKLISLKLN
jgi:chromosome segregation protein